MERLQPFDLPNKCVIIINLIKLFNYSKQVYFNKFIIRNDLCQYFANILLYHLTNQLLDL
jgi:hypothetical protein